MPFWMALIPDYFYPRPPRGGRRSFVRSAHWYSPFLSTSSARRTTNAALSCIYVQNNFYPRPPRGGRHPELSMVCGSTQDFYPRPPRGGRQREAALPWPWIKFLSTSSARRTTTPWPADCPRKKNFYPRPPRGGRRGKWGHLLYRLPISIHVLREEDDLAAPGGGPV